MVLKVQTRLLIVGLAAVCSCSPSRDEAGSPSEETSQSEAAVPEMPESEVAAPEGVTAPIEAIPDEGSGQELAAVVATTEAPP